MSDLEASSANSSRSEVRGLKYQSSGVATSKQWIGGNGGTLAYFNTCRETTGM